MDDFGSAPAPSVSEMSADSDMLILVDGADREIGHLSKVSCHEGQGVLHRAFSLLVFNGRGELLIQRRARSKRLWPLHWSNSCCSHPRRAESLETATRRRLGEELGVSCPLTFLYKFRYQAQFDTTGAENEMCSVYVGRCMDEIRVNRDEIAEWRWIGPEALTAEMTGAAAETFTPWFRLEWERIERDHRAVIRALQAERGRP